MLSSNSQHEISQRYPTDFITVRQQANTLQHKLEKEVRSHADTVLVGSHVIINLRVELDTLCQKMAKKISVWQQETTGDVRTRMRGARMIQWSCSNRSLKSTDNALAPELPEEDQVPEETLPKTSE